MSQDHIELFFGALRCLLGSNNNPSSREFQAAYKRLLLHHEIRGKRGNSILQDDTSLLVFTKSKNLQKKENLCEYSLQKKFGLIFEETDHDYCHVSCFPDLSEFQSAVLEYIAGYSVRMANKLINCELCLEAISERLQNSGYKLVETKDRGGLIHVNPSVKVICEMTEQFLQTVLKTTEGPVTFKTGLTAAITSSVLKNVLSKYQ